MRVLAVLVLLALGACTTAPEAPRLRDSSELRAELLPWDYLRNVVREDGGLRRLKDRTTYLRGRILLDRLELDPSLREDPSFALEMGNWVRRLEEAKPVPAGGPPPELTAEELVELQRLALTKEEQAERTRRMQAIRDAEARRRARLEELEREERRRVLVLRSNEAAAKRGLKEIALAQELFRLEDSDRNGKADYWVLDVAGLHQIIDRHGQPIALLDIDIADADLAPGRPATLKYAKVGPPRARSGYRFARIESCIEGGEAKKYDDGTGRNAARYGLCAVPVEPWVSGEWTYILDERQVIWRRNTAGQVPACFPADPEREGWEK